MYVNVSFNAGLAEFDTKKMMYIIPVDELRINYDTENEDNKELVKCAKETEVDYLSFTRVYEKNIHYLV